MNKIYLTPFSVALVLLCGLYASPTIAKYEKELGAVDKLIKERKYRTAADFINKRKLSRDPRFTRRYVHILARKYIATKKLYTFAIKDLKSDERLEKLRGKKYYFKGGVIKKRGFKTYILNMDKFLYQQLKKHPRSPDIQLAIGDYLSASVLCQCHSPKYFIGKKDADFYARANNAGVYDNWSLLRIGYNLLYTGGKQGLDKSIGFLKKSHELNPKANDVVYYLAIAYHFKRDLDNANRYASEALGKFTSPSRNADSYTLHGRINTDLGYYKLAEQSFRAALSYDKAHKGAFSGLLRLHLTEGENEKYTSEVKRYLAQNYSDKRLFNNYIYHLESYGMREIDRTLISSLATVKISKPMEIGVFNYGLGRIYQSLGQRKPARHHFLKSLGAFKSMRKPPRESVNAVNNSLLRLGKIEKLSTLSR